MIWESTAQPAAIKSDFIVSCVNLTDKNEFIIRQGVTKYNKTFTKPVMLLSVIHFTFVAIRPTAIKIKSIKT